MSTWQTVGVWAVWVAASGVCLAWLGDSVFPRVAWWSRRQANRLAQRSSLTPYAATRAGLYLVVAALTIAALYFPDWAPWAAVIGAQAANQTDPISLLPAAAALLALLLFAVTQMRALEKENTQGEKYLNQNLTTYLALRSWPIRIFDVPLFVAVTLVLFLIPIFIRALPRSAPPTMPDWIPWAPFAVDRIALALWCACFGVVGAVLLLNAINALRLSTAAALRPAWLRRRVEMELRRESAASWDDILTDHDGDQRRRAESWVTQHLDIARDLPPQEQLLYLEATTGDRARLYRERSRIAGLRRKEERLTARWELLGSGGSALTAALLVWRRDRRRDAYRQALSARSNTQWGIARAMLRALAAPGLPERVRDWIVGECLYLARAADDDLTRLERTPANHSTELEKSDLPGGDSVARDVLTRPARDIHRIGDRSVLLGYSAANSSPRVIRVTASIIVEISAILLDDCRSTPKRVDLVALTDAVGQIRHRPTRSFAESTIAHDAISHIVQTSDEDATVVLDFIESVRRRRGTPMRQTPTSSQPDPDLVDRLALAAASRLSPSGGPTAEATNRLLTLIADWRVPASLLHALFYQRRSHDQLEIAQVLAFSAALAPLRNSDVNDIERIEFETRKFLTASGYIGHFVHPNLVRWLFDSLQRRLSIELCADFLKEMDTPGYSDFALADFVIWHSSAASRFSRYAFEEQLPSDDEYRERVVTRAGTVTSIEAEWHELAPGTAEQLSDLAHQLRRVARRTAPSLIDPSGFV